MVTNFQSLSQQKETTITGHVSLNFPKSTASTHSLMDTGAQRNYLSVDLAKAHGWCSASDMQATTPSKTPNGYYIPCYGRAEIPVDVTDSFGTTRSFNIYFDIIHLTGYEVLMGRD